MHRKTDKRLSRIAVPFAATAVASCFIVANLITAGASPRDEATTQPRTTSVVQGAKGAHPDFDPSHPEEQYDGDLRRMLHEAALDVLPSDLKAKKPVFNEDAGTSVSFIVQDKAGKAEFLLNLDFSDPYEPDEFWTVEPLENGDQLVIADGKLDDKPGEQISYVYRRNDGVELSLFMANGKHTGPDDKQWKNTRPTVPLDRDQALEFLTADEFQPLLDQFAANGSESTDDESSPYDPAGAERSQRLYDIVSAGMPAGMTVGGAEEYEPGTGTHTTFVLLDDAGETRVTVDFSDHEPGMQVDDPTIDLGNGDRLVTLAYPSDEHDGEEIDFMYLRHDGMTAFFRLSSVFFDEGEEGWVVTRDGVALTRDDVRAIIETDEFQSLLTEDAPALIE